MEIKSLIGNSSEKALQIGTIEWTYPELFYQSTNFLKKFSDKRLIAILAHREIEAYAGILAAYNSGRTYVPISPKDPPARVAKKLELVGCTSIISSSRHEEREKEIQAHSNVPLQFIDFERGEEQEPVEFNEEYAYIMFTSGTTGEPKPVPVKRSSLEHYVQTVNAMFDFHSEDRFTQFFDLSFDLSVHDLFVCWSNGACLYVPETDDVFKWPAFVREAKPTVWFSVPSVVRTFDRLRVLKEGAFPSIRLSLFCGEALHWSDVLSWKTATNSAISNLYGPTECTIAVGVHHIDDPQVEGVVPIGKPFSDHQFDILDGQKDRGEMIISGPQVFEGYLGQNDQPFVEQDGELWYRTGDLVSKDEQDVFHFHGRLDDQVKIRGHRVELGEIDAVLNAELGGSRAVTIRSDQEQTIAFIEGDFDAQQLIDRCKQDLPPHMHPYGFRTIDIFPLNTNGKVDRNALRKMTG